MLLISLFVSEKPSLGSRPLHLDFLLLLGETKLAQMVIVIADLPGERVGKLLPDVLIDVVFRQLPVRPLRHFLVLGTSTHLACSLPGGPGVDP